jgi:hypothetical protein
MTQLVARALVIDRRAPQVAWRLDRSAVFAPPRPRAQGADGLVRALGLAVPISALLWVGALVVLLSAIR